MKRFGMKLIFAVILAASMALCACAASAETVKEQVGAPDALILEFSTATGKTHIHIDAVVTVPEVEAVPVYAVRTRQFTKTEIEAAARVAFGDIPYQGSADFSEMQFHKSVSFPYDCTQYTGSYFSVEEGEGLYWSVPSSKLEFIMRVTPEGIVRKAEIEYQAVSEYLLASEKYEMFNPSVRPRTADILGANECALTQEQARARADALAAALAPQLRFAAMGVLPRMDAVYRGVENGPEAWIAYYTRAYELPYAFTSHMVSYSAPEYAVQSAEECLKIVINDEGVQALHYQSPYEITSTMDANARLMPFEQIMINARALFPLAYAYLDGYEGEDTLHITAITLGYMRVMRKDMPDQLMLIPV